jgi:hypothetical protein
MLKDYVATRRTVTFEGGEFSVRGVSIPDVAALIVNHREAIDKIAYIVRTKDEFNMEDIDAVIMVLIDVIRESPYLVADLICACCDEPDAYGEAFKLPLIVQIEALRTIGELTFSDADALKKLTADARRLLQGMLPTPRAA